MTRNYAEVISFVNMVLPEPISHIIQLNYDILTFVGTRLVSEMVERNTNELTLAESLAFLCETNQEKRLHLPPPGDVEKIDLLARKNQVVELVLIAEYFYLTWKIINGEEVEESMLFYDTGNKPEEAVTPVKPLNINHNLSPDMVSPPCNSDSNTLTLSMLKEAPVRGILKKEDAQTVTTSAPSTAPVVSISLFQETDEKLEKVAHNDRSSKSYKKLESLKTIISATRPSSLTSKPTVPPIQTKKDELLGQEKSKILSTKPKGKVIGNSVVTAVQENRSISSNKRNVANAAKSPNKSLVSAADRARLSSYFKICEWLLLVGIQIHSCLIETPTQRLFDLDLVVSSFQSGELLIKLVKILTGTDIKFSKEKSSWLANVTRVLNFLKKLPNSWIRYLENAEEIVVGNEHVLFSILEDLKKVFRHHVQHSLKLSRIKPKTKYENVSSFRFEKESPDMYSKNIPEVAESDFSVSRRLSSQSRSSGSNEQIIDESDEDLDSFYVALNSKVVEAEPEYTVLDASFFDSWQISFKNKYNFTPPCSKSFHFTADRGNEYAPETIVRVWLSSLVFQQQHKFPSPDQHILFELSKNISGFKEVCSTAASSIENTCYYDNSDPFVFLFSLFSRIVSRMIQFQNIAFRICGEEKSFTQEELKVIFNGVSELRQLCFNSSFVSFMGNASIRDKLRSFALSKSHKSRVDVISNFIILFPSLSLIPLDLKARNVHDLLYFEQYKLHWDFLYEIHCVCVPLDFGFYNKIIVTLNSLPKFDILVKNPYSIEDFMESVETCILTWINTRFYILYQKDLARKQYLDISEPVQYNGITSTPYQRSNVKEKDSVLLSFRCVPDLLSNIKDGLLLADLVIDVLHSLGADLQSIYHDYKVNTGKSWILHVSPRSDKSCIQNVELVLQLCRKLKMSSTFLWSPESIVQMDRHYVIGFLYDLIRAHVRFPPKTRSKPVYFLLDPINSNHEWKFLNWLSAYSKGSYNQMIASDDSAIEQEKFWNSHSVGNSTPRKPDETSLSNKSFADLHSLTPRSSNSEVLLNSHSNSTFKPEETSLRNKNFADSAGLNISPHSSSEDIFPSANIDVPKHAPTPSPRPRLLSDPVPEIISSKKDLTSPVANAKTNVRKPLVAPSPSIILKQDFKKEGIMKYHDLSSSQVSQPVSSRIPVLDNKSSLFIEPPNISTVDSSSYFPKKQPVLYVPKLDLSRFIQPFSVTISSTKQSYLVPKESS